MFENMKRQLSCWALFACIATGALLLAGCSTVSSRIESNRAAFDQLSPKDQALVSQGKIGPGMSQQAVYIAWGQPQQKAIGDGARNLRLRAGSTRSSTAAYGSYGYGFGGWGYGYGFAGPVGFYGRRGGRRFYGAFVNPYWDPFYYPFAATVSLSGENGFFPERSSRRLPIPGAERLLTAPPQALCTNRLTRSSTVTMPVSFRRSSRTAARLRRAARSRRMIR